MTRQIVFQVSVKRAPQSPDVDRSQTGRYEFQFQLPEREIKECMGRGGDSGNGRHVATKCGGFAVAGRHRNIAACAGRRLIL